MATLPANRDIIPRSNERRQPQLKHWPKQQSWTRRSYLIQKIMVGNEAVEPSQNKA
jgi:hypothetical protein